MLEDSLNLVCLIEVICVSVWSIEVMSKELILWDVGRSRFKTCACNIKLFLESISELDVNLISVPRCKMNS